MKVKRNTLLLLACLVWKIICHHGGDDDRRHRPAVKRSRTRTLYRGILHRSGRVSSAGRAAVRLSIRESDVSICIK